MPGVQSTLGDAADRVTQAFTGRSTSVQQHVALWDVAWTASLEDPWLGSGPDLFPMTYVATADAALDAEQQALFAGLRPESPHNVLLALATGSGLPSMLAYLGFVALVVAAGIRTWRRSSGVSATVLAGLLAAVAGHLTTDMFMTAEVAGSWTFWALLGAIVAASSADPASAGSLPAWRGTTSSLSGEGSEVPSAHAASKPS
jgi:O-antigen ligase